MVKNKKSQYVLTVLFCCCMAMAANGISYTLGVFYLPMAGDLQVGVGDIAVYGTLGAFATGFLGPLFVKFCTHGKIRLVMLLGFVLSVVSLAGMAWVTSLWQLYILGVLGGIGKTFCGSMMFAIVLGNWFKKGMGISLGLVYSTSGLTSVILSPVITSVISNSGWRTGSLVMGIISAVLLLPVLLFLKRSPRDAGLEPYGATGEEPEEEQAKEEAAENFSLRKDKAVWRSFIAMLVLWTAAAATCALGSHFSAFAQSLNYSAAAGSLIMSTVMASNMGSKLIMGFLCDKFGAKRSSLAMLSLTALGCLILTFVSSKSIFFLAAGAFLFGVSFSVASVSVPIIARDAFGAEKFGKVYSYTNLFGSVGSALSSSLVGYSYDISGSYLPASAFFLVLSVLCIFLVLWVYRMAKKINPAFQK